MEVRRRSIELWSLFSLLYIKRRKRHHSSSRTRRIIRTSACVSHTFVAVKVQLRRKYVLGRNAIIVVVAAACPVVHVCLSEIFGTKQANTKSDAITKFGYEMCLSPQAIFTSEMTSPAASLSRQIELLNVGVFRARLLRNKYSTNPRNFSSF